MSRVLGSFSSSVVGLFDDRHLDQGLRSGDRRARSDRQEARGRRPAARALAGVVRARRAPVALLSLTVGGGRASHRNPQRARGAETGARLVCNRPSVARLEPYSLVGEARPSETFQHPRATAIAATAKK